MLWVKDVVKKHSLLLYFTIYGTIHVMALLFPLLPSQCNLKLTWKNGMLYFCPLKLHVNKLHLLKPLRVSMLLRWQPTNGSGFVIYTSLEHGPADIVLLALKKRRLWSLSEVWCWRGKLCAAYESCSGFIRRLEQMASFCHKSSCMTEQRSKEEQGWSRVPITHVKRPKLLLILCLPPSPQPLFLTTCEWKGRYQERICPSLC